MSKAQLESLIISKGDGGGDVKMIEYPSRGKVSTRVINDIDAHQEASFSSQEQARDVFQKIARRIDKDDNLIFLGAKLGDVGRMRGKEAEWDLDEILAGRKGDTSLERALQGKGKIEILIGRYIPRKREWIPIRMNYRLTLPGVSSGKELLDLKRDESKLSEVLKQVRAEFKEGNTADGLKELYKVLHLIGNPSVRGQLERLLNTENARKSRVLKWIELVEDYEEELEDEYREIATKLQDTILDLIVGGDEKILSGGYRPEVIVRVFEDWCGCGRRETRESIIEDFLKRTGRKSIQKRYIPESLTLEDLKKQLKSIEEGTDRPELKSFQSRPSKWTTMAKSYFGKDNTAKEDMAKVLSDGNPRREREIMKGFDEIYDRGMKAYETSGSRPNQTPYSWGQARVYGVLFGSPARNQDKDIVEKYRIPLLG